MKTFRVIPSMIPLLAFSAISLSAQQPVKLGQNAALRYWSAFAEMQDYSITEPQAKELNLILAGTVPYDDVKYKDLVEKNRGALETMGRGTAVPNCDWGVDYALGPDAPVDYVRKALALGRLNVLYALHLLIGGDKDGAVRTLAAGVRFSHDVASGGSLFATLAAKDLLVTHLRSIGFALHVAGLSAAQRQVLEKALSPLVPGGLDWQSAVKRELDSFHGLNPQASAALARIAPAYMAALSDSSQVPALRRLIASAPHPLPEIIPNPERVVEEKQDLISKIHQMHSLPE
jgi:hypothetical protein